MKRFIAILMTLIMVLGLSSVGVWADDSWTTKASMPTARNALETIEVDGMIYAIGGEASGALTSKVEMYNPSTDTWSTKTNMPTPRSRFAIAAINNKIYVIGGYSTGSTTYLNTVEEYNIATDTWTTKASIPTGKSDASAFH